MTAAHTWTNFRKLDLGGTGGFFTLWGSLCGDCGAELIITAEGDGSQGPYVTTFAPACPEEG
ncbi:MAG: hypothetical protein L3K00_03085 [Thermoplasmata archaeon]|jgi:hypothetical protein|nr:hypothetical protein [Thermoplasmata archaeon]